MTRTHQWILGIIAVLCAIYAVLTQAVMPRVLTQALPYARNLAANYINGSVTIGKIEWNGGFTVIFRDVEVDDVQRRPVAKLPEMRVTVNPFMALRSTDKAISTVAIREPVLYVTQDTQEKWNIRNLMKPSQSDTTPFYGTASVQDGTVVVSLPQGRWEFGVNGKVDGSHNPVFDLDFTLTNPAMAPVHLTGGLTTKGVGKVHFVTDRVSLEPFAALAAHYGQVREAGGEVVGLNGFWHNDGQDTLLQGTVTLRGVRGVRAYGGRDWKFSVGGTVTGTDHAMSTKDLTLTLNGQVIHLDGDVDYSDLDHLRGTLHADAPSLSYGDLTVRNVRVDGALVDSVAFLRSASFEYGGGSVKASGDYDLKSGALTAQTQIDHVTVTVPARQAETIGIHAELALQGTFDRENARLKASLAAHTFNLTWRGMTLKVADFDTDVTEQGADIHTLSAFMGPGALTATGKVGFDGTYALQGRLADIPVAPFLAVAGEDGSGYLSAHYAVQGKGTSFKAQTGSRIADLRVRGIHVKDAAGRADIDARRVTLQHYVVQMDQGRHVIDGTADFNQSDPALDLTVSTENVRVEPLLQVSGLNRKVQATGNLTNSLSIHGTLAHPDVTGEIDMTDGSVMGYLVEKVSGRYACRDGALSLEDGLVRSMSTTVKIHGTMDKAQNLDFEAAATDFDLAQLPIQDERAALTGFVSVSGHLGGTLQSPLFEGNVKSDSFTINGVEVKALSGTLRSNGKDLNELKAGFQQPGADNLYAEYRADLTLDIPHRDLRGRIGMSYADVHKLLAMAKADLPVQGIATGMITFNGPDTPTLIDAAVHDISVNTQHYDSMTLRASFLHGVLDIHTLKLQEDRIFPEDGILAVQGKVDFPKRTLQIEAGAVDANPGIITALMSRPVQFSGLMNATVQLGGTFDNPTGNGSLEITQGTVAGAGFDRALAMLTMKDGFLHLDQMLAERDIYKLTASGDIPLDLFRAKGQRKDPNAQMDINVDFNEASLAALGAFNFVEWGTGGTKGKLNITGTLDNPQLFGNLSVENGSLKIRYLNNIIDNINMDVAFDGSVVHVRNLSARLGQGFVAGGGTYDLSASGEESYNFQMALQNAQITSQFVQARLDGNLIVRPEHYFLRMGDTQGFPREGYRPKITMDMRLDDVLVNMPTIPELGDSTSNIGLDVKVTLGSKVHLYNKYLYDMWLQGSVHARGSTLFPVVDGSIETVKGDITYLRTDFKVDEGRLLWMEPGTFLPNVNLTAHTQFGRYRVLCNVSGPLSQGKLDMKLTSEPSLPQSTLSRMLMLQRFSVGGNSVTGQDMQNLLVAGLETGMLGDVEQIIRRTLHIDQFRVYLGRVENGVDFTTSNEKDLTRDEQKQYNWLVAKNLTDRWSIGYTSSFNGDDNNVYTQYELTDRLFMTISKDKDSNKRYSVEYRVGF